MDPRAGCGRNDAPAGFDADLDAIEKAEIYANGGEAETVVMAIAAKYPPRALQAPTLPLTGCWS